MAWSDVAWRLGLSTVLAGCGPDGGGSGSGAANYEVHLLPLVPSNQEELFAEARRVTLVVEPEVGDALEYDLDTLSSGSYDQVEDLGALEYARLSLVAYDASNTVMAYGQSERVSISTGEIDVPMMVGKLDELGWLAPMTEALSGGVALSDATGRFLVIGGSSKGSSASTGASANVLSFTVVPPNEELQLAVVGQVPVSSDAGEGRVGHVAVLLEGDHADAGKVLIAGGSSGYRDCADATDQVFLWDPGTGESEELGRDGRLDARRYLMRSAVDAAGNVVMAGGAVGCTSGTPRPSDLVHFYVPNERRNVASSLDYPGYWPTWMPTVTALADDGTIICGGVDFDGDFETYTIAEVCHTIDTSGNLASNDFDLPIPLAWHEAVTLDDGTVLVTGGLSATTSKEVGEIVVATNRAFIREGTQWREVGKMHNARAMHRMARLPDGRVLVVGGVSETDDPYAFDSASSIACVEFFDPSTGAFYELDDCDSTSSTASLAHRTAHPMLAADDKFGVLVAGGLGDDGNPLTDVSLFFSETVLE